MNAFGFSQLLPRRARLIRLALVLLMWFGCGSVVTAQCSHSATGHLRHCVKCGRNWVEQDEPLIVYSDQSSPIHGPHPQRSLPAQRPVIRQLSVSDRGAGEKTPSTVAPVPFGSIGALPIETHDPERWLREQIDPSLLNDGPATAQEWYDVILADPQEQPDQLSWREDLSHAWVRLRSDVAGVLQPNNLIVLGVAGGGAAAIHQDWDGNVRDWTRTHPKRWGEASDVLQHAGSFTVHVPVMAGLYLWSLKSQDEDLHDLLTTMGSAYTINAASTVLLKAAVNSQRPDPDFNGGQFGFPSYHSSSTFTIASVLNEYYGWRVGLPAYAVAGMVGWSRIDKRDHDLSDVVFGAALGYVIGTSIAKHYLTGDSRVMLMPWNEPSNGAVGLAMEWRY